jgi:TrmH family RNA methyltransferase
MRSATRSNKNEMITSIKNPNVQYVRDLLSQKKHRDQAGAFVVEGVRLAEEALAAQYQPTLAFFSSAISERGKDLLNKLDSRQTDIEEVEAGLLDRISATETSQGLLIVFRKAESAIQGMGEPILVLDQIRDPGNLGTILRSACAFGFTSVILTPGSADPFSPKALRSGMGAQFKLPVSFMDAKAIQEHCKNGAARLNIFLADAEAATKCWEIDLAQPLCLIIGSEAFGAEPAIRQIVDRNISIPMQANNESLNAAMSANILMYEVYRQRKKQ